VVLAGVVKVLVHPHHKHLGVRGGGRDDDLLHSVLGVPRSLRSKTLLGKKSLQRSPINGFRATKGGRMAWAAPPLFWSAVGVFGSLQSRKKGGKQPKPKAKDWLASAEIGITGWLQYIIFGECA